MQKVIEALQIMKRNNNNNKKKAKSREDLKKASPDMQAISNHIH